jgi:hypothetical protein
MRKVNAKNQRKLEIVDRGWRVLLNERYLCRKTGNKNFAIDFG